MYDFTYTRYKEQLNSLKQKVGWWLPEAGGKRKSRLVLNGYRVPAEETEKSLKMEGMKGDNGYPM